MGRKSCVIVTSIQLKTERSVEGKATYSGNTLFEGLMTWAGRSVGRVQVCHAPTRQSVIE